MDTNWQHETWPAINYLAPVMPEVIEEKHVVQNRDKFTEWIVAGLFSTEKEAD